MNRLATIEARGAIESGAAAILANEALAAMRPRGSEEKKQELERARGIGYKRFRRPPASRTPTQLSTRTRRTSTRYRPALEVAQAMSLPEGAVVAITAGLRFIGQRLDPRHALGMSEARGISESELDALGKQQEGVFQTTGDKEEDMRNLTEQIRKAIEGNREDRGDDG